MQVLKTQVSAAGPSSIMPVMSGNGVGENCQIGFAVIYDSGADMTVTVQHTFDDPIDGGAVWFTSTDVASVTGNADGVYTFPVRAIRLNVEAWTAGKVRFVGVKS